MGFVMLTRLGPKLRTRSLVAMAHINKPVPGAREFYPLNEPAIGTPLPSVRSFDSSNARGSLYYQQNSKSSKLFEPLTIRGKTFKNRIFVVNVLQYVLHTCTHWITVPNVPI
jgi:hypothetical protein